jgi:opacity protein-like surface antigen
MEAGWMYNNVRGKAHGEITQYPLLANAILNYQINKWVPYFGLGGGGDAANASVGRRGGYDNVDLACQAQVGVRYEVSSRFDLGFGYKYTADFLSKNFALSDNSFLLSATYHF